MENEGATVALILRLQLGCCLVITNYVGCEIPDIGKVDIRPLRLTISKATEKAFIASHVSDTDIRRERKC